MEFADKLKEIIENRTAEDEESIRLHDENSFYAIDQYCKKHGLIFHDNEMSDIVQQARPTIKYFKKTFFQLLFPTPFFLPLH